MSKCSTDIRKSSDKHIDRILGIIALVTIIFAWFVGFSKNEADLLPYLKQMLPEAHHFELLTERSYTAWEGDNRENLIAYITVGTANGYGGTLKIAAAVDTTGTLKGLTIVEQRETYYFLRRVLKSDLLKSLTGKTYSGRFAPGGDINVVTGATSTSKALLDAVGKAVRYTARKNLGFSVPPESSPEILFGIPEVVLILLYTAGIVGRRSRLKIKNIIRWGSMLAGLVVLGFLYNIPLNLVFINKLILGFWPEWQTHLYWYLLIGGVLFAFTFNRRNPYCEWFCPFGAAQECLNVIGGIRVSTPERYRIVLLWTQRGIAWLAVILAMLFRNPSISGYDVFSTFFELIGSNYLFVLLGIVLTASLFIKRPWCSYLCPIRSFTDFIRMFSNWGKEIWKSYLKKRTA